MYRYLNPAVDRFRALDEEKQEAFRNALGAFVRLYAFLSQIMPFRDTREQAVSDEEVVQRAHANEFDNFALASRPKVEGCSGLVVDQELARRTYEQIRGKTS